VWVGSSVEATRTLRAVPANWPVLVGASTFRIEKQESAQAAGPHMMRQGMAASPCAHHAPSSSSSHIACAHQYLLIIAHH
jgi:hypothetical protein